jgi:putative NIF3 family GTP cyclohydrolase 1 type 2
MDSSKLCMKIEEDFDLNRATDNWGALDLGGYMVPSYREKWNGLLLDNTRVVERVYTAVFPDEKVLEHVLRENFRGALLFTHHPMIWDPTLGGLPFRNIPPSFLPELKERETSLYSLHTPLDENGPYSTSTSLARALNMQPVGEFFTYGGVKVGTIGKTLSSLIEEVAETARKAVGHEVKVWEYGDEEVNERNVAIVAGGGNYPEAIDEITGLGLNLYLTGVSRIDKGYRPTVLFHERARENGVNIIAATHYSTEKFACIAMTEYFNELGLPSEFIEGNNLKNDLE